MMYKVCGESGDDGGKYVVAVEDIPAGQLIIKEDPVFIGPARLAGRGCVGCGQGGHLESCSSCGLYLCQQCLPMTRSLHSIECNLLSQVAAHTMAQDRRVNTLVSVARLLLCHGWDHLEGNVDARVGCDAWEDIETGVIPLLCKARGKDGSLLFSKEHVHLAAGILDTNCFEYKPGGGVVLRCLYSQAARINNSCVPNCTKEFSGRSIEIHTSRLVHAGEELTICYTGLLLPTQARQEIFRLTKQFQCCCSRCRDPTELGTYLASVLCPVCEGVVHSNHCLSCGLPCTEEQQAELTRIASDIASNKANDIASNITSDSHKAPTPASVQVSDNKCDSLRSGLESLKSIVSKNHYILARAREAYILHAGECQACRDHPCYLSSCLGILQLINTLQPGHTRARLG